MTYSKSQNFVHSENPVLRRVTDVVTVYYRDPYSRLAGRLVRRAFLPRFGDSRGGAETSRVVPAPKSMVGTPV